MSQNDRDFWWRMTCLLLEFLSKIHPNIYDLWKVQCVSHSVVSNFCNPMDCSLPGSSVHGILQARRQEWVAIPFSRGSSQPKDWTHVSHIAGGFFTTCATREALPGPPLTKYHKLSSLHNSNLFSHSSGNCQRSRCCWGWFLLRPLRLACRSPSTPYAMVFSLSCLCPDPLFV